MDRLWKACWVALCAGAGTAGGAHAAFIYACDGAAIYRVDVDDQNGPTATLLRANAGALSIAPGNTGDELFVHDFVDMRSYTISNDTLSGPTGVLVGGNAFGEGLDGYWYMGASNFITRHIPDDPGFSPVNIAGAPDMFAGDFATANDGTSYGAMNAGISIINKLTGAQTPFSPLAGMWGLAFTADGRMFAGAANGNLYEVDLSTGLPTFAGNLGFSIADLASERGVIPAPGAGVVMVMAGLAGMRRRR